MTHDCRTLHLSRSTTQLRAAAFAIGSAPSYACEIFLLGPPWTAAIHQLFSYIVAFHSGYNSSAQQRRVMETPIVEKKGLRIAVEGCVRLLILLIND